MESLILDAAIESLIPLAAVLSVGTLFVWAVARARRTIARNEEALPLLTMLACRRRAPEELKRGEIALAMRRCVLCSSRETCSQKAAAGLAVPDPCPNASFIARVCDPRST